MSGKNEVLVITKEEVLAWAKKVEEENGYNCGGFGYARACYDKDSAECHLCKRITEFRKEAEGEAKGEA